MAAPYRKITERYKILLKTAAKKPLKTPKTPQKTKPTPKTTKTTTPQKTTKKP